LIIPREGNILTSKARVIVCPVNTVGVMGAGLAKAIKAVYPQELERDYKELCNKAKLHVGEFYLWRDQVLLFPTKQHWSDSSNYGFIMRGLELFVKVYGSGYFFDSVAFPLLGAGLGGLDPVAMYHIEFFLLNKCSDSMAIEIWSPNNGK